MAWVPVKYRGRRSVPCPTTTFLRPSTTLPQPCMVSAVSPRCCHPLQSSLKVFFKGVVVAFLRLYTVCYVQGVGIYVDYLLWFRSVFLGCKFCPVFSALHRLQVVVLVPQPLFSHRKRCCRSLCLHYIPFTMFIGVITSHRWSNSHQSCLH